MYEMASLSVSTLLRRFSYGRVGMCVRRPSNASLIDCIRRRSRRFAACRCCACWEAHLCLLCLGKRLWKIEILIYFYFTLKYFYSLFNFIIVLLVTVERVSIGDWILTEKILIRTVWIRRVMMKLAEWIDIMTHQWASFEEVSTHDRLKIERIHREHLGVGQWWLECGFGQNFRWILQTLVIENGISLNCTIQDFTTAILCHMLSDKSACYSMHNSKLWG